MVTHAIKDFGAIDAQFKAVDERFSNVNKDIGRLEGRVEKLEGSHTEHHDGLNKHEWAIDGLTKALVKVSLAIEEWAEVKQQVKGGLRLWKFIIAPIGGGAGLVYIYKSVWGG